MEVRFFIFFSIPLRTHPYSSVLPAPPKNRDKKKAVALSSDRKQP